MNQYQVKIPEHNAYLVCYKVVNGHNFIININESVDKAGRFDEDDYVLEVCRNHFPQVIISPCGRRDELEMLSIQKESPPLEELDWI